ncbi:hypothetical protein F4861DRAFT_489013 [Xylaria intraflava]|nr:hypothetical protein F4861DRAFT_489013 [Xylaria intraflava]
MRRKKTPHWQSRCVQPPCSKTDSLNFLASNLLPIPAVGSAVIPGYWRLIIPSYAAHTYIIWVISVSPIHIVYQPTLHQYQYTE